MAPRSSLLRATVLGATCLLFTIGCENPVARQAAIGRAEAQVRRIAEDLDQRTTATGVYVRVKEVEIQETDPWGTPIAVSYSQGGVAEVVSVRSAGPDRKFQTKDDVAAHGVTANFKGVGEGIKNNAEETAANVASGLVQGTLKGVKQSINKPSTSRRPTPAP